jgi:hypothetical protein
LRGSDIKIDSEIIIKSYTLNQIIDDIGVDKYSEYMSYIANSPYDMRAQLYECGMLYDKITHWQLFLSSYSNILKNNIRDALLTLISIDLFQYFPNVDAEGEVTFVSLDGNIIDETKFNYIVGIIREINGYPEISKEPKFGNETSLIYELERHIRRLKKGRRLNGDVTLKSIISSMAWAEGGIGIKDVWDLTLYQLYDGLNRKGKRDKYNNLMFGIYTGNINAESVNLNKENWYTN